jgi:hypothetical protein
MRSFCRQFFSSVASSRQISSRQKSVLLVRFLLVRNVHAFLAVSSSRQISSRQSLSIFTPSLLSALYSVYLLSFTKVQILTQLGEQAVA